MKMEQTECSETSAYKIQRPRNYPEENIQHTEHGESLKSRLKFFVCVFVSQRYKFDPFAVATVGITSALRSLRIESSVYGEYHLAVCAE